MDVEIRVAQVDDYNRILEFLRIHYYPEEPLTLACQPLQQDKVDEEFNMSHIEHGACLVATSTCDGDLLGVLMAGPKLPNEAQHLFEEASRIPNTKWGKMLRFLGSIERDANVFERFGVDRALHCHVLAVHSSSRGKSIGMRLVQKSITIAKELGYPLWTVDCTSVYSAKLFERLGWECVNVCAFADYCDANGERVFLPPAPHEFVKTFALRLN